MSLPDRPVVSANQIAGIHLKSQALVNLFFGIPMVTLVLPFWGLPIMATIKVTAIYLTVYILYFVPLWFCLPRLLLRPIKPVIDQLNAHQVPDDLQLKKTVEFLLNYPFHSSVRQYVLIITGFIAGSLFIPFGAVSQLMPIQPLAIIYVLVIGLVVSLIEAFLNFTFLENYISRGITQIITLRPVLATESFNTRRISLLPKMVFVILGTVISAQLIIFIFMIGKLAIELPQSVAQTILYLGSFMVLTAGYVVVAAILFTRNISTPLHQLIDWSGRVSHGDRTSLALVTNDEINDVALYANQMVANLGKLTSWLEQERDQLSTEKNKLAVVVSNIADGVVATDSTGKIVLFNKAMEALTGWGEEEVLGQSVASVLNLYRDSGRSYSLSSQIVNAAAQPLSQTQQLSLRLVSKQQQNKYVILSTSMITHQAADQVSCILTFHDITEAQELERMKIDFVSMAAHELRTPLTSIKGYLDVLNKEAGRKLTKDQALFLQRSMLGADQLSALIENLLNVSRIENQELHVDLIPISLNRLVEMVAGNLTDLAAHNSLTIKFANQPADHLVMADQMRLTEVITNLLANAINYARPGTAIEVRLLTRPSTRQTILEVEDQGAGIPPEAVKHLFTKFYRVSGQLSAGAKGTGLGLYISKSIIEAHHGKIWAKSKVGQGSTFSFSLPWASDNAIEASLDQPVVSAIKPTAGGSTNQLLPNKN